MKIGFAKRDITPAVGCILSGNGDYVSTGIHDPLDARAVVMEKSGRRVALVSCDLLGIDRDQVAGIKSKLQKHGHSFDQLLITCTHTHNGPTTCFNRPQRLPHRDEAYLEKLEVAVTEAIIEAAGSLVEALMKTGRGFADENFNRRLVTPDGEAHFFNPPTLAAHPEYADLVGGVTDQELNALQFLDAGGRVLLTMVQYAAHPLTVGKFAHVITRDFCGRLVDLLEEAYEAPAVFIQGACGDLHCRGLFEGFIRMEEMANNLATEVKRVLNFPGLRAVSPTLQTASTAIRLEVDQQRRATNGWRQEIFDEYYAVEMAAFRLGPIALVGIPGELCCELGLRIKGNAAFSQTWLLYICNSYAGYLISRRAYLEKGYEYSANCLMPSASELVVQTASDLCRQIEAAPPLPTPAGM